MDLLGFILRVCHLDGVNANVWGLDDLTIQPSPNVSAKSFSSPPPNLLVRFDYNDRASEEHRLQWQIVDRKG